MAGIVVSISDRSDKARFLSGLASIRHHPSFRSMLIAEAERFMIGATFRQNDPPSIAWNADRRIGIIVYGFDSRRLHTSI